MGDITVKQLADSLGKKLMDLGFLVQRYDSYSTNSIYLKLDYGVCNSIRIADHPGKKHLSYRYNLMTDIDRMYTDSTGKYPKAFYSLDQINKLLEDIQANKNDKISSYGPEGYRRFMQKNIDENKDAGGFWAQARLLNKQPETEARPIAGKKEKQNSKPTQTKKESKPQQAVIGKPTAWATLRHN